MEEMLAAYFARGGEVHRFPQGKRTLKPLFAMNWGTRKELRDKAEAAASSTTHTKEQRKVANSPIRGQHRKGRAP